MVVASQQNTMDGNDRVGEVIHASTTEFVTECYTLYDNPPIGCLVECGEDNPVFGVVADSVTESIDPTRPPAPKGKDMSSEREIYSENPQLSQLLATRFTSIIVGYVNESEIKWHLSPKPPRILSFVKICSTDQARDFSVDVGFLPRLLDSSVGSPDEVVAAYIRHAAEFQTSSEEFVIRAGKELTERMPGQLRRVSAIIRTALR